MAVGVIAPAAQLEAVVAVPVELIVFQMVACIPIVFPAVLVCIPKIVFDPVFRGL